MKILLIFSGTKSGAVTTLPPLQESRPKILGLSEEGGVFLTKTSLAFLSYFFLSMIRPPDFEELDGAKRGVNFPLIPKRQNASEGRDSNIGFVTNS